MCVLAILQPVAEPAGPLHLGGDRCFICDFGILDDGSEK